MDETANPATSINEAPQPVAPAPAIVAEQVADSESDTEKFKARLDEIRVNFDHVRATCLEKADWALEYVEITERLHFGQDVQKSGPGRPGIISQAARELALPGKTDGARRKWLERALKIASISPQAKSDAKKAKLARYQNALLEIASADGEEEQLQKVAQIAARKLAPKNGSADQKILTVTFRYSSIAKNDLLSKLVEFAESEEVELLHSA